MGNRGGRLHRADGTLGRARWRSRAWICCRTHFRDRQRQVMGDGYTEIFFLDEATALAAGHRPCFECRRADARAFAAAWGRAEGTAPPRAGVMDARLHAERLRPHPPAPLGAQPDGTIFRHEGAFWLKLGETARLWTFSGYGRPRTFAPDAIVVPITPARTRAVLAAGYRPRLHPSAET